MASRLLNGWTALAVFLALFLAQSTTDRKRGYVYNADGKLTKAWGSEDTSRRVPIATCQSRAGGTVYILYTIVQVTVLLVLLAIVQVGCTFTMIRKFEQKNETAVEGFR